MAAHDPERAREISRLRSAVHDLQSALGDVEEAIDEIKGQDVPDKPDLVPWALRIIREFQPSAPWLAAEIRRFVIAAEGQAAVA